MTVTAPEPLVEPARSSRVRTWSTDDRPAAEQDGYWREVVCQAFTPLLPQPRGSRGGAGGGRLRGRVAERPFGTLNGAEVAACDQVIHHGPREVHQTPQDAVFVNFMVSGRSVVRQGGAACLSGPGTFSLVDTTRPFSLEYLDAWRAVSFRVPHAALARPLPAASTAVVHYAGAGLGGVVADALRSLWRDADALDELQADGAGAALASLVGALAHGSPTAALVDDVSDRAALRSSIEAHVLRCLPDGDASPAAVAGHAGISVRSLHQLYADAPSTFARTVMGLRVQRCAEDLLARGHRTTLTELAAAWGFSDLSHLNRAFQRHLGCRASEHLLRHRPDAA